MRRTLLLVALIFPTALTWLYFVALADGQNLSPTQQAVYVVGKILQFVIPLIDWYLWDRQRPAAALFARRGAGPGVIFGLLVGLGLIGFYFLALRGTPAMAATAAQVRLKAGQLGVASPLAFLALAVFLSVIHSALEEYYWRWYAFGQLRTQMPWTLAATIAGLAFMSHHTILLHVYLPGQFWQKTVPLSLAIAVGGFVWAWLYQRSGSLVGSWISHVLIDAAIFVVGYDLLRPA